MATPKHSVLLVDDEPEILFSLRGLLRREFELYTAESGAQALEILRQHPVQVIMTDQRMPQMTGTELLKRSQGESPTDAALRASLGSTSNDPRLRRARRQLERSARDRIPGTRSCF